MNTLVSHRCRWCSRRTSMKMSPEGKRYSMPSLIHLPLHLYITKVLKILWSLMSALDRDMRWLYTSMKLACDVSMERGPFSELTCYAESSRCCQLSASSPNRLFWWQYERHCFHCDAIDSISPHCLRRVAYHFLMAWETASISPVSLLPRLSYLQVSSFAMAAGRNSTQPTYDFLTGASSPPPPSFRETLRTSHVVRPGQLPLWPFGQAHR